MRIVPDQVHPAIARARLRRRILLALFGVFLVGSLLALTFAGLHSAKVLPPPDHRAMVASIRPDAIWYFQLPVLSERWIAEHQEEAVTWRAKARVLMSTLHSQGAVFLFTPPEGSSAEVCWAVHLGIRRPQRVYVQKLQAFLEERAASGVLGSRGAFVKVGTQEAWICSDEATLVRVTSTSFRREGAAPLPGSVTRAGCPLIYEGLAAFAPAELRSAAIDAGHAGDGLLLQAEWLEEADGNSVALAIIDPHAAHPTAKSVAVLPARGVSVPFVNAKKAGNEKHTE
ncbi:MAG: hypothetical protein PWP23_2577 [Candidatus Sumerlaeota bacterium]|nr:hypothetical protein [Candidatus Sumerlaeota bacterium]